MAVLGATLLPLCSFGNARLFQSAPIPGRAWLGFQRSPLVPSWLDLPKTRRCDVYSWIFLGLIPMIGSWWALVGCPAALMLLLPSQLGTEWTAPGEFTKFSSQVSKPLR